MIVFYLAAAFLILSPLSVATGTSLEEPAKWLRLLDTFVIVLVGASRISQPLRSASSAMLVFACFYAAAAVWSDSPLWGLFYKGMFVLTLLSGMMVVYAAHDANEFHRGLRCLGAVAGLSALVTFFAYLRNPSHAMTQDRLAIWGLNANLLGSVAGSLLLLCLTLAAFEYRASWRYFATTAVLLLSVVILGTGSRGSALMTVVGALFLLLPTVKRPGILFAVVLLGGGLGFIVVEVVQFGGADRLMSLSDNNRNGIWSFGWKRFLSSPLIGHGWLHYGRKTLNLQSSYLQVLVECGLLGAFVLSVSLTMIAAQLLRCWRTARFVLRPYPPFYLAAALVVATLVHGIFENATLAGTSINAFLLGIGLALLDRCQEFARQLNPTSRARTYVVYRVRPRPNSVTKPPAVAIHPSP